MFNSAGQVAFVSNITGPGVSAGLGNGSVLWATGPDGTLEPVVRTGTLFTDGLGNTHTIASFNLATNTGNEDGRASSFNDDGYLAFNLAFTDGASGHFVTLVPEPTTGACMLVSAFLLFSTRKKKTA
jgi:hypothetical protein